MSAQAYSYKIGEVRCTPVNDGSFPYPAAFFFSNISNEERTQLLSAHHLATDQIIFPYTCLLIQTVTNNVLLDTGGGEVVPGGGRLLEGLQSAGVRTSDIDTVVVSHAHPDHIGGILTAEGKLAFPNARFVMSKSEWEFWTAEEIDLSGSQIPEELKTSLMVPAARRFLPPITNRVDLTERATEIVPGVQLLPAQGHTPGHSAILITSGGDSLLHIADAVLHPVHVENPAWQTAFDLQPEEAARTRLQLLDWAAADRMKVMTYHFPLPGLGHVVRRDGAWAWEPFSPDDVSLLG